MEISKIVLDNDKALTFKRLKGLNTTIVTLPKRSKNQKSVLRVYYEGEPRQAQNAPWDGGFTWKKDNENNDWLGVSCEGIGASLWWPCKDHLSDEPDSMRISCSVPSKLMCVANGNLKSKTIDNDGYTAYDWRISYPINNYNVTLNVANYTHFEDKHTYKDGTILNCDYYVLPYNLAKAKKQFAQVHPMLDAYDKYFGHYPFMKDGYALVETSYLGMEHQGAIAYGNKYLRGYLGGTIPEDMNWDYIIIHESGHEYFGNSISCADHADMWLHESFTTYMEALYVESTMSYKDAVRYLESQRPYIDGSDPIVGPRGVNFDDWKGSDMYYKGAWILHTLRSNINNDKVFFGLLRGFYDKHKISITSTEDFIKYVNAYTRKDYTAFFKQYLYQPGTPTLEYKIFNEGSKTTLEYRWNTPEPTFRMPVKAFINNRIKLIYPTTQWRSLTMKGIDMISFDEASYLMNVVEY
jgi:aminopeptidase N